MERCHKHLCALYGRAVAPSALHIYILLRRFARHACPRLLPQCPRAAAAALLPFLLPLFIVAPDARPLHARQG